MELSEFEASLEQREFQDSKATQRTLTWKTKAKAKTNKHKELVLVTKSSQIFSLF